jgi:hypothetical protein
MMRRRKVVIGTVACAFAVSILLLAAILIAPKVVDSETVKAKVRSELLKVAAVEGEGSFSDSSAQNFAPFSGQDENRRSLSRFSRARLSAEVCSLGRAQGQEYNFSVETGYPG